jgi:hypothetical protein
LLEEDAPGSSLTTMLQGLNRFLLERVAHDYRSVPPHSVAFDQVSLMHSLLILLTVQDLGHVCHYSYSLHELSE